MKKPPVSSLRAGAAPWRSLGPERVLRVLPLLALLLLPFIVPTAASKQAQASEVRLLVFGDSLAQGYGLPEADAFPMQLEEALRAAGHEVRVVNGGVSGDTSAMGRARLGWALSEGADAVILELGANDALRGLSPQETEANLDAMLAKLSARGIPTLLAGMKAPRNLGSEYVEAFDGLYPRLAEKHGLALYPFFLEKVAMDPALNLPDGKHPNAAGVRVIVANILPSVISLLEEARRSMAEAG
jgi:acyl-CoA thioesterase-1